MESSEFILTENLVKRVGRRRKENSEKVVKKVKAKKTEKEKDKEKKEAKKTEKKLSKKIGKKAEKNIEEIKEIIEEVVEEVNDEENFENTEKNIEKLELGLYSIKEVFEKNLEEGITKFIKNSIRSGNKIMYEGSLVIIGDVNAGAEIIAGGNIIILGDLRGVAHAGATGNKKAIIAAESIESPQLRIANLLWENEVNDTEEELKNKKYAYVESEKIKLTN